ncbi:MAG: hybrid sensor histidine kinase/response regulator [Desulfobacterales bacterium]|nr:hybrid sensor histidine kinase/response regulator [Desulfobacterales bacterium]
MEQNSQINNRQAMILLVDDIPENIQVLGKILQNTGYSIAIATNAKETFELLERELPDLILLDVMLPDLDGFEICKKIKENELIKDIPIIFLTAKTELEDKIYGFEVGAVDYITKPFKDIEVISRVRTHVQLKQSKDMIKLYSENLEKTNATKDKLFSIIAHDLRSPMNHLFQIIDLIRYRTLNKDKEDYYLKQCETSIKHTMVLLDNLLNWAKSQQNQMVYTPQPIDIVKIVYDSIAQLSDMANDKTISLKSDLKTSILAYADPNMIITVMRNLIQNAIKFTHTSGTITISANKRDTDIEISVADTGIGMSQECINNLFKINMDRRFIKQGTENEKGTGIGLLLCKEFVEKNNGSIWVESQEGKGSTFRFTIPKYTSM